MDSQVDNSVYEIRAFPNGIDRYSKFTSEGFVAIGWPNIGDVTNMSLSDIKSKINYWYPGYQSATVTKIANFFIRLKTMRKGDILLIPYISGDGPTLTIATVAGEYAYHEQFASEHLAHQVNIKVVDVLSREDISQNFDAFNRSLNARLTLTKIDTNKHLDAVNYIRDIVFSYQRQYFENPDPKQEYKKSIIRIIDLINDANDSDDLLKKTLIFSALSINEAYLSNLIREKVAPLAKDNQTLYQVLRDNLLNRLYIKQTRDKLASVYFKNFKLEGNDYELRNKLAHNMQSVTLENNEVLLDSKENLAKDNEKHVDIIALLDRLQTYADNIIELDYI